MKIHKIQLDYREYQSVQMPNGAAPISAEEDGPNKIALYFIGPDTLVGEYTTKFGAFVIPTGTPFPDDLKLFPIPHPLTNQVEQPNARYLATVNGSHVFLGAARPTLTSLTD